MKKIQFFDPLCPSVLNIGRLTKVLILRRDHHEKKFL